MCENKPSRRFSFALALLLVASSSPPFLMAQSPEGSGDSSSESLVWLTEAEFDELQTLLTTSETELIEQTKTIEQLRAELTELRSELTSLKNWSTLQSDTIATLSQLLDELRTSLSAPAIGLGLTADYGASGLRVGVSVGVTF